MSLINIRGRYGLSMSRLWTIKVIVSVIEETVLLHQEQMTLELSSGKTSLSKSKEKNSKSRMSTSKISLSTQGIFPKEIMLMQLGLHLSPT